MRQDLGEQHQKPPSEIAEHTVPQGRKRCYWVRAFVDARPLLAEFQKRFGQTFELVETPNPYGAGFQGQLDVGADSLLTIQVMTNFQDVKNNGLVPSRQIWPPRTTG